MKAQNFNSLKQNGLNLLKYKLEIVLADAAYVCPPGCMKGEQQYSPPPGDMHPQQLLPPGVGAPGCTKFFMRF